jgi:hypothetical protein
LDRHVTRTFGLGRDGLPACEARRRRFRPADAAGGLLHGFIHIFLTLPVFLLFPTGTVGLAAALLAGEFFVHYHIDWTKEQIVRHYGWKLSDRQYWCALGLDQLLHGLTYIAILWIWLPAA